MLDFFDPVSLLSLKLTLHLGFFFFNCFIFVIIFLCYFQLCLLVLEGVVFFLVLLLSIFYIIYRERYCTVTTKCDWRSRFQSTLMGNAKFLWIFIVILAFRFVLCVFETPRCWISPFQGHQDHNLLCDFTYLFILEKLHWALSTIVLLSRLYCTSVGFPTGVINIISRHFAIITFLSYHIKIV